MNPDVRYDLHPGEWRPDPPRVSYGCDRSGIVAMLEDEQSARPWTQGEREAGPEIEVQGRTLACPPNAEDIAHLQAIATPAPYGRGEDTLLDPEVRDALQVGAEHVTLGNVVRRLPARPRAGRRRSPHRHDIRGRARPRETAHTPQGVEPPARLGAVGARTYAEWHTEWAACGNRTKAGNEQYGQKTAWVLSHRYTEPGLRPSLLKGRDREFARVLVDEPHGEACYLAWLQIREVGAAWTEQGRSWGDDSNVYYENAYEFDDDPPPPSIRDTERVIWEDDPVPHRMAHRETPELHLRDIARQNVWIEGLRSLAGEDIDHGPIEVMDGEIVPPGALAEAVPKGARVYEATGNEGASLELQYRRAALVVWRRNRATLRILARCGGRLAIAVEFAQRRADARNRYWHRGEVEDVLALWAEALETDGGGPAPKAHQLVLEEIGRREDEGLRDRYVETVAAVDLDASAVPTLVGWICDRVEAGEPMDVWVRALRGVCGAGWAHREDDDGRPVLGETSRDRV